jgi:hypothetical protein
LTEDQTSRVLDLYVEEKVLGADSRFFREAGVRFGRLTVGPVADDDLPPTVQRRADRGKWRFDMLSIPFQLEDLGHRKQYLEASVRLTIDGPDVRSVLFVGPERPYEEAHVEVITGTAGLSEFAWRLLSTDERLGVRSGGREFQAVMESPLTSETLSGSLDARVRYVKRSRRWPDKVEEAEPKRPLMFRLNVTDGAFEFVAAQ